MDQPTHWNRRGFLKAAAASSLLTAAGKPVTSVSIVADSADAAAGSPPVRWAARQLAAALAAKGIHVEHFDHIGQAPTGGLCVVAAGPGAPGVQAALRKAGAEVPSSTESMALASTTLESRNVLLACGYDLRAIVYALLELADRVRYSEDAISSMAVPAPIVERPANKVRSWTRLFTSDVEDKPWYHDRQMWPQYLDQLATQRFNRFNLAFGIGYDFIRHLTDGYLVFSYPFLLDVPGYSVRVPQLPNSERDLNLEMLKFIAEETVARGMEFQLGLWMHGYEWIESPNPNYTIEGVNSSNHGPYCRDAVRLLLQQVPKINGITFRVHGESGVEEGSYQFWKTVFEGVATCGRRVEIDMHAKGMDQTMIDLAVGTRQPVKISPKYWAEHLGMPYHQADIRQMEMPKAGHQETGLMKFSAGSRSFLRYGYGDLLREDRSYGVIHRIWPGTQRLLLWGDPVTAAGYSRAFSFCGSDGVEICEPLSFKGRRGSGIAGDRCAYLDPSLKPRWDWQKYEYQQRVMGRLLYNPACSPDVWRRYLDRQFGPGAQHAETALANASRILPIVTTGHAASAGNNTYWPEIYLNHSLIDADHPGPYTDSPAPKVFGNVSPLDPQLFSRINDFADQLLNGESDGKYSPVEVAQWIEDCAATGAASLERFRVTSSGRERPEFRRYAIDVAIETGLGTFFGAKFRAGVLYRIYEKTGSWSALDASVKQYRRARDAWSKLANLAKGVYKPDITVGEREQLRGHWLDRLPAIDKDIAELASRLENTKHVADTPATTAAIQAALARPRRVSAPVHHTPAPHFIPGQALQVKLAADSGVTAARLFYRHVTQAERYQTVPMTGNEGRFVAEIPAAYTESVYPLEYYFEVRLGKQATLFPGFARTLDNQPYFVVRQAPSRRT